VGLGAGAEVTLFRDRERGWLCPVVIGGGHVGLSSRSCIERTVRPIRHRNSVSTVNNQPPLVVKAHLADRDGRRVGSTPSRPRLKRGAFTSVAELSAAITKWAEHWNLDRKPFIWKAPADDIIAKVKHGRGHRQVN
jgi:hypothetical protein